jgi:purine-cytosine permease-like protein
LGPTTFQLGWPDSISGVIVGTIIGSLGPGLLVSLGAKSGLRCMTVARYAFGLYAGALIAFLNVLTCVGFAMVNTMAGAEAFYAMTNTKLPLAVCVLILAVGCGFFFLSKSL